MSLDTAQWLTHTQTRRPVKSVHCSVMSNSLWPHGLQPTRLLYPRDFLGKNTWVGSHSLLQGIFPTQRLNLCLRHFGQNLYHCSDKPAHCNEEQPQLLQLGASQAALVVKLACQRRKCKTWVRSLVWDDPLEEVMAAPSSILAWRIPWTEEPGGLQSRGSQRAGHNWSNSAWTHVCCN